MDAAAGGIQGPRRAHMSRSRVLVAMRVAAPPARTFAAFTGEIGEWWQPNGLFRFTDRDGGRLAFEPEPPERLVEIGADGERFEIGRGTGVGPTAPPGLRVAPGRVRRGPVDRGGRPLRPGRHRDEGDGRALRLGLHPAGARRPPPVPVGCVPAARGGVVAGPVAQVGRTRLPLNRAASTPSVARWPPDPANTSSPRPAAMPVRPRPRRRRVSRATPSGAARWCTASGGARSRPSPPTPPGTRSDRWSASASPTTVIRCSSSASWRSTRRTHCATRAPASW